MSNKYILKQRFVFLSTIRQFRELICRRYLTYVLLFMDFSKYLWCSRLACWDQVIFVAPYFLPGNGIILFICQAFRYTHYYNYSGIVNGMMTDGLHKPKYQQRFTTDLQQMMSTEKSLSYIFHSLLYYNL